MNAGDKKGKKIIIGAVKCLLWGIMAAVLFVAGWLVCVSTYISNERLTEIVSNIANKSLDARVDVGAVDVSIRNSYPFLNIDIDRLTIRSRQILELTEEQRASLPDWADTLCHVKHLHGGINLVKALEGKVVISDLELTEPELNLLVADSIDNYSIFKSDPADTTSVMIPDIRFKHVRMLQPRPVRYADIVNDVRFTASLSVLDIDGNDNFGSASPGYRINLSTDIDYPSLETYIPGIGTVPFSLSGSVVWHNDRRHILILSDLDFHISRLSGKIDTELDFSDGLQFNRLECHTDPVPVNWLVSLLPDSLARSLSIPPNLDTDADMNLRISLKSPYRLLSIPHAGIQLTVPDCRVKWNDVRLTRFRLDAGIELMGLNLNRVTISINDMVVEGPSMAFNLRGSLTNMLSDPTVNGEVHGRINASRLPATAARVIGGTPGGMIQGDLSLHMSSSMLSREKFHRIGLSGSITADSLYYLSDDTLSMFYASNLRGTFGSGHSHTLRNGVEIDSVFSGTITADSMQMLVSNIGFRLNDMTLDFGSHATAAYADSIPVIPMGGHITAGYFSATSLSDSLGTEMQGINGRIVMVRNRENTRRPIFFIDTESQRLSIGDPDARFSLANAHLRMQAAQKRSYKLVAEREKLRNHADSVRLAHPELPIDSVYKLALEVHQEHSHHVRRVFPVLTSAEIEVLEWNVSSLIKSLLLDWDFKGNLSAPRGRLTGQGLYLRNRARDIDIDFCNDSVNINDLKYRSGHSDLLISGTVSNIPGSLTDRRHAVLKARFDISSDTIDVNELLMSMRVHSTDITDDPDAEDTTPTAHTDSVNPLLIPTNIFAELSVNADAVKYSDLMLHNLSGDVLVSDGSVNLHGLRASSAIGSVDLTALYTAPSPENIDMKLAARIKNFDITDFLQLVPQVDSVLPVLRNFQGILSADLAAETRLDSLMRIQPGSLDAAMELTADSLVVLDQATYKKVQDWLMLGRHAVNMIPSAVAELTFHNRVLTVKPFVFNFDRYRLGVEGTYLLGEDFNCHVAVLRSPVPWRFGINVTGRPGAIKVRFGGPHFNEKDVMKSRPEGTLPRIEMLTTINNAYRNAIESEPQE